MFRWLSVLYLTISLLVIGCKESNGPIPDSRVNDYALMDASGGFHRMSTYNNSKGIVLWVQGNGCPIVRNAVTDFNAVVADYSNRGFKFFMINSNPQDDREETFKESQEFQFSVPVLMDQAQLVADALDFRITSEAIVLHPVSREVLYRGPVNNRLDYEFQKNIASESYLRDALDAILNGTEVTARANMTRGCTVTRMKEQESEDVLTFTEDIAPILSNHCARCHRDGGIAPWAMTDYETVKGWSSMIRQVLLSKRMPPWKADTEIGSFKNSFALADSNARKIMRWINSGMPKGSGTDPLTQLTFSDETWQAGEPDTIVSFKPEKIPATGLIPYRYQKIPLHFEKETWLRGIEIKPGNAKVLHHIVITNTERNREHLITNRPARPWTDNYIALGGGADQLTIFPDSTGVLLPAGTTLTAQIHYTPTGKPEEDQTRLGLYLSEEAPKTEFLALSPSNTTFVIPPYTERAEISIADTITRDINIHYIVPHMHYRGKEIRFSVIDPEGNKETLVSVPDFNFNWQWMYKLDTPYFASRGSIILVEGIYDNSFQNPLNPDPSQELRYGIQSTDEMLIGFFNYTLAD